MTNTTNALTARIAALKETIALCIGDLRYCNTSAQVQSVNAVIAARKAELAELEEKAQAQDVKKDADVHEAEQVSTCFSRGSDVLEDSGVRVALPVCTDQSSASHQAVESEFITRIVTALDDAPMGTHGVYVHWFRIDYGCWLDAEEVVNAGGLAEYMEESLGLSAADVAELMTRDWDCQDAEGLAARCIGNYGGFDWLKLEELLEVGVGPAVLVAGLACGLEPEAIEDAYMGEWGSDEDMAFDQWEQGGILESIPEAARGYIDWGLVARDLLIAGSVTEANGHYFHAA